MTAADASTEAYRSAPAFVIEYVPNDRFVFSNGTTGA